MKQHEHVCQTTYRWWRVDHKEIPESHINELNDRATATIAEMSKQGFVCGQLSADVGLTVPYEGYWEIKTVKEPK